MKTAAVGQMKVPLTAVLGTNMLSVTDVAVIREGSIIELNTLAGEPIDVLAAGELIAKAEVVIIDENFGIRVTEVLDKRRAEAPSGDVWP